MKVNRKFMNAQLLKSAAMALVVCAGVVACKDKDKAPAPATATVSAPLQDPLAGYLAASGYDQEVMSVIDGDYYEFGYSFIPLVNGKITAIVVKIPDVHMELKVTVWDKAAGKVLRTESVDVANANVEVIKQIAALDLVKDKEYIISMNGNDWYSHYKTSRASADYPFTVGDIKITSYGSSFGTEQTMPQPYSLAYSGDCSFKFQK